MMKQILNKKITSFLLVIVLIITISCKKERDNKLTLTYNTVINTTSNLPVYSSKWIKHNKNTPAPKEGDNSPFDAKKTTNGIFHQWSWQKFLWLTKPTKERQTTYTENDNGNMKSFVMNENVPFFLNSTLIRQVDSSMDTLVKFKNAFLTLKATHQAGATNAVLKTNPNYNDDDISNTIYYSLHVSQIFYNAAVKFKTDLLNGNLQKDNQNTFPVGSFELKAAWVEVNVIPKVSRSNFYITVAAVQNADGNYINKQVALLGMHVVGVVKNHPEFIWATFEHNDLAPSYNWHTNSVSTTNQKLLFSKGSTTGLGGIIYNKSKYAIAKKPYKVFSLFKYGVPTDSTGYIKTSQPEPLNFNNIVSINKNAVNNLTDVWKNYYYNGSIWIDTDGMSSLQQAKVIDSLEYKIGKATPKSFARGSLNNANISMETFTQTFKDTITKVNVNTLANCFSCHTSQSFNNNTSPIYLSHIFDSYININEGYTIEEVENMKSKQEIEQKNRFLKNR